MLAFIATLMIFGLFISNGMSFSITRGSAGARVSSIARSRALNLNMGIKLVVSEEEPVENALRRFKKAVNQSGHLMDLRFKEHWETAADKKKRKAEKARLLNRIERTNDKYERKADGASEYNS
eukprot:gene22885-31187_t